MRAYDIIHKKRAGGELSKAEIYRMVHGFALPPNPAMPYDPVPDYQMAALLMAICFQGMSARETADLTMSLVHGGAIVDLSGIEGKKVDKHSTGGVGDKTTLVLIPLVAAAGAKVAKMSGRGLGHTGGTLDKLESIPGFHIQLSSSQFVSQVNKIGAAVVGQSAGLCPADQKLYALRDVTATVESIPLIASSIMSKKIAGGAEGIVLDVKVGSGAFMKTLEDAEALASAMVAIGRELGRETVALITEMEQPLGFAVGNALEVAEAIETLSGRGPADLTELCLALGSQMLVLAGVADSEAAARSALLSALSSGAALAKFKEFVAAQGGSLEAGLPVAPVQLPVVASSAGYVGAIDALGVGQVAMKLGAGRETKDAEIDLSVGVVLQKKVGDAVAAGETLAVLHARSAEAASSLASELLATFTIVDTPSVASPIVKEVIR